MAISILLALGSACAHGSPTLVSPPAAGVAGSSFDHLPKGHHPAEVLEQQARLEVFFREAHGPAFIEFLGSDCFGLPPS